MPRITGRDFPASTLRAHLKQVDFPALDEMKQQALVECFPYFSTDPGEWYKSLGNQGAPPGMIAITSGGIYDITQGRFRRYAGGRDLPGARYFSVCKDEHGNDGGTLCYELMSYWDCTTGWWLDLTDSTVHRAAIEQSPLAGVFEALHPVILVIASDIAKIKISKTGQPYSTGTTHPIPLPLRLVQITCDNVLDLRLPAAQDWLAAQSRCSGTADGFLELLPNLLSPLPGGNDYHRRLGAWLRAHGCQGLVFPSARRDIGVAATDEEVIDSDGWSFVSYADARMPDDDARLGPPFPWLTSGMIGVDIFTRPDDAVRSWWVQGAEAGEWGRIYYEIRRSRGRAPVPSHTFNPYYDGRSMWNTEGSFFSHLEPDE